MMEGAFSYNINAGKRSDKSLLVGGKRTRGRDVNIRITEDGGAAID